MAAAACRGMAGRPRAILFLSLDLIVLVDNSVVPKLDIGETLGSGPIIMHLNRDQVQGTHPLIKPGSPKMVGT